MGDPAEEGRSRLPVTGYQLPGPQHGRHEGLPAETDYFRTWRS